ncbi:MAG: hypothetical protein L7H10_01200 [Vulcanisaeta sp.]|jgi:hypothetical protein|nr:hypothetical protein [Vulcanisaeta sp.]MCG2869345.1 hypothetical protein [Vulcanisaeta sp.]MCG2885730.1 hypothetical protein [Vulcanisaeta sp.]
MSAMSNEARLALLLLEELELRGGRARLKYLKVYRLISYWLGKKYAEDIINKLVSSGYISIRDDVVELLRRFKVNKSLTRTYREARDLVISIYLAMQRPPSK